MKLTIQLSELEAEAFRRLAQRLKAAPERILRAQAQMAIGATYPEGSLHFRLVEAAGDTDTPIGVADIEERAELIDAKVVGRMLNLSPLTVVRRSNRPGDPLRRARARIGKQRPVQFWRSAIEEMKREELAR